ncbi:NAD(P)/FAD-dependent oxidoreductase [Heliobacterium gestii]|uniref:NAD(P)/FAD-dependent oxidoreductase n=1 Tax=Heliomicrobium gestii TaxID=2699 RepID=A0A845LBZ3_HELGE|nr:NAD(P)/FAD-dependent oxidoreductase [Heliomicrobium gestii]MBM7867789.1 NAD(P)H-nitrite reductase large subunit [Heliomicrobium gestii]MZP44182.1 NAD(P)/FAD-dependent oxidoreductase [Heliomicrobium gestii]
MDAQTPIPPGFSDMLAPRGANKQRDKKTFAIVPHHPGGFMSPNQLMRIAQVAQKYATTVNVTSGQQIMLIGLQRENVEKAWQELGREPEGLLGPRCRGVRFCPGIAFCKRATSDSIGLGTLLDKKFRGMDMPNKVKMSVAGCYLSCTAPAIRDIGIIGLDHDRYRILIGGAGGHAPRLADLFIEGVNRKQVLAICERLLHYYRERANPGERMGEFVPRFGLDRIRREVLGDMADLPRWPTAQEEAQRHVQPGELFSLETQTGGEPSCPLP